MENEKPRCGLKPKTIKSIIHNKINAWLESIEDKELRTKVSKNVIVTGGSIASMLLGEPVNDYDVYLRNYETTLAVAKYYLERFKQNKAVGIDVPIKLYADGTRVKIVAKSSGIASEAGTDNPYEYFESRPDDQAAGYVGDIIENPEQIEDAYQETEEKALNTESDKKENKYRPVFLSTNAITLSDKVQIVLRFYGEPDEIHDNYDFAHCTNYWSSWDNRLVLRPAALEALLSRDLRYIGSKYPICSVVRVRKFVERGWRINAGQLLKMAMQVSKLDLTSVSVLEDQLTGVDTAYFTQLIDRLKQKDPEKIDAAYLVEIIDRIF